LILTPVRVIRSMLDWIDDRPGHSENLLRPGGLASDLYSIGGKRLLARACNFRPGRRPRVRFLRHGDGAHAQLDWGNGEAYATVSLTKDTTGWRVDRVCPFPDVAASEDLLPPLLPLSPADIDCPNPGITDWLRVAARALQETPTATTVSLGSETPSSEAIDTLAVHHDVAAALLHANCTLGTYRATYNSCLLRFMGDEGAERILKLPRSRRHASLKRFEREIGILKKLQGCRGVLALEESGIVRGIPYHVTRAARGTPLQALTRQDAALSSNERLIVFRNTVDVVCAIHDAGVIHRDIAPDHVFATADFDITVIDFGLSCFRGRMSLDEHDIAHGKEMRNLGLVLMGLLDVRARPRFGDADACLDTWRGALAVCASESRLAPWIPVVTRCLSGDTPSREPLGLHTSVPYTGAAELLEDVRRRLDS
jgi:hypothetical protein